MCKYESCDAGKTSRVGGERRCFLSLRSQALLEYLHSSSQWEPLWAFQSPMLLGRDTTGRSLPPAWWAGYRVSARAAGQRNCRRSTRRALSQVFCLRAFKR